MPDDVFSLFDDYAARFARGERPDTRAYLARAGSGADELAQLIDGFLTRAVPPAPSEETIALTTAALEGRSPLVEARERRGLSRADVVDALVAALGLDRAKLAKIARYYGELETAARDPRRVDRRVFEALASTLRTTVSDLVAAKPRPDEALAAFSWPAAPARRMHLFAAKVEPAAAAPEPPDEIDLLFGAS
jgi:hypothetical protein